MLYTARRTPCVHAGITEYGGHIVYKANVKQIVVEGGKATGVKLADGRVFRWAACSGCSGGSWRWQVAVTAVRKAVPYRYQEALYGAVRVCLGSTGAVREGKWALYVQLAGLRRSGTARR